MYPANLNSVTKSMQENEKPDKNKQNLEKLRTVSFGWKFTGSYKKKSVVSIDR